VREPFPPETTAREDLEYLLSLIERAKVLCFVGQAREAYDVLKSASEVAERYTPTVDLTEELENA
jgi:hypothetical protein